MFYGKIEIMWLFYSCWPSVPIGLTMHSDISDQAMIFYVFRLSWSTVPARLTNTKNPDFFGQDFCLYRLLIDLSPNIFIVCDLGIILSSIASANAPPSSLLCQPATSNWEQNIVECVLYLFSNTSRISCCSILLVFISSHSSRISRSHLSYCLILCLYVPCILESSSSDSKSGSQIYLTFSPLLHASTPSA